MTYGNGWLGNVFKLISNLPSVISIMSFGISYLANFPVSGHCKTTAMKQLIFILTSIILLTSFTVGTMYIDPTGTYQLDSKTKKKNGDIYGYSVHIQVKK